VFRAAKMGRRKVLFDTPAIPGSPQQPKAKASKLVFNIRRQAWQFHVQSEFLGGKNLVTVLLPDEFDSSREYPVVYLLPVEPASESRYGNSLAVIREIDAHNRYGVIFVDPAFDTLPWCGSHATNPRIRHDEYIIRHLVPLVEERWPTPGAAIGRLLFGFSKSGWGAFTLAARHSDVFGFAASWDAPLMLTEEGFGCFGTERHFGTKKQFSRYLVTDLLRANAASFTSQPRLVLGGANLFGDWPKGHYSGANHTEDAHGFLNSLGILHDYQDDLNFDHSWNRAWMEPMLEALLQLATRNSIFPSRTDKNNPCCTT